MADNAPNAGDANATPKPSLLQTIAEAVKSNSEVQYPAILAVAQADEASELKQARVTQTKHGISLLRQIEKGIRAIKPKHLGVDLTGKPVGEPVYDKVQAEAFKKLNEQQGKVLKAFAAAETGDWNLLSQLKDMKVNIGPDKAEKAADEPAAE